MKDSTKLALGAGAVLAAVVIAKLLQKPVPPPPPGDIGVTFNSDPVGADVYVDDFFIGKAPTTLSMDIGTFTAKFKLAGYEDYSVDFTLDGSYSSVTVGAVLIPNPPPVVPGLTLRLDSASEYITYGFGYPHITGRVSNESDKQITNRDVKLHRRFISPSSGMVNEQTGSLAYPLTVYGSPLSAAYPPFTLAPGQGIDIDFISPLDLPHDVTNDLWLQDAVTGDKSAILRL